MPPEAELPPPVVEGPRSRFATPAIRVRTSMPVPAGAGRAAFFTDFAVELAFFFVAFFADFFFVVLAAAFLAGLFLADFFAELLAAFDFLPDLRAAMLDFPSRSWFFDLRAAA